MKKSNLTILSFLVFAFCSVLPVSAADFSAVNDDGKTIWYNVSKDGNSCEVTYKSKNEVCYDGVVFIPETVSNNGKQYKVTGIGQDAFRDCSDLMLVFLPKTIRTIGNSAFMGCGKLKSIECPDAVQRIGKQAFANCVRLTRASFGKYLQSIESKAFFGCTYLAYLTIGAPAKIESQAFDQCDKLIYIYCKTDVAPIIVKPEKTFLSVVYRTSVLIIPEGSKDNYSSENGWKDFRYVRES